jgi:hypothetical protein
VITFWDCIQLFAFANIYGDESSIFMKCEGYLNQLCNCHLLLPGVIYLFIYYNQFSCVQYKNKDIQSRRNSGNACYHSVQSLLSSRLLSRNVMVKYPSIHPSNGATAQLGPWPPLLRFRNNNVSRCEVVSLTTNPLLTLGDL